MAEAEGFAEDAVSLPTPSAVNAKDNKFGMGGGPETVAQASPSFGENDFPRQTGSDSLSSEESLLT